MDIEKMPKREKKEDLIWVDDLTGEVCHAGVAFYIEEFNEYRMVLDAPRTVLYLKMKGSSDATVYYSVYAFIECNGKYSHRVEVGTGFSSKKTSHRIYIRLGRHSGQHLILLTSQGD